jgi:hypothetical protein
MGLDRLVVSKTIGRSKAATWHTGHRHAKPFRSLSRALKLAAPLS